MAKYKVGIDFTLRGIHYVTVEAESEDAAKEQAMAFADDEITRAVIVGNYGQEIDICDVIPAERSEGRVDHNVGRLTPPC